MTHQKFWRSSSIRAALEGRSVIDSKRLFIDSLEAAYGFLSCYGYEWQDADDREAIEQIRLEAIALIQEELLRDDELFPPHLAQNSDIPRLMLQLSQQRDAEDSRWICALLRVMHTLAHSHSYLNDRYQEEIRDQILSRFLPHIIEENGHFRLGDIELAGYECRPAKSRRSVALKLLHKTENVAADIFDWIGLRFITHYKLDVLQVLAFLRYHNIVMFANIKPSRSRNTLLRLDQIEEACQQPLSYEELCQKIEAQSFPSEETQRSENPYSESTYHSVQFTCRQRIHIHDPLQGRFSFFFPFEIQIIDKNSYQKARYGMASHDEYKRRQKIAIRQRVLPHLDSNLNS